MALVLALLVALVVAPASAEAQGLDSRIQVKPGGLLQVDLDLGEEGRADRVLLDIRSHAADEVYAVADLSGLGSSTVRFRVEPEANGVRLYGRSGGIMSWLFGGPSLTVRVWVPREFSIDARSSSGPIRIEDVTGTIRVRTDAAAVDVSSVEGTVRIHTGSGAVRVSEVEGDVAVRASNAQIELSWITGETRVQSGGGDIQVRHIDGPLELRTDSGEITLRDVRGNADVKTEQGAVYASFTGAPRGRLETQRGSVEVVFPSHIGVDLEARSARGTVQILDGMSANGSRGADHFVGDVNGGGTPLQIYTARGNIRVGRR